MSRWAGYASLASSKLCTNFPLPTQRYGLCYRLIGTVKLTVCYRCMVGCLTSQQQTKRISGTDLLRQLYTLPQCDCSLRYKTCCLIQWQYIHTGPTSPGTDPMASGAWLGSHFSSDTKTQSWLGSDLNRDLTYSKRTSLPLHGQGNPFLRVDTVVETKLAFKLVKTPGHCSTVHGKFLVVLDFLVATTSTDILVSKGTPNL